MHGCRYNHNPAFPRHRAMAAWWIKNNSAHNIAAPTAAQVSVTAVSLHSDPPQRTAYTELLMEMNSPKSINYIDEPNKHFSLLNALKSSIRCA